LLFSRSAKAAIKAVRGVLFRQSCREFLAGLLLGAKRYEIPRLRKSIRPANRLPSLGMTRVLRAGAAHEHPAYRSELPTLTSHNPPFKGQPAGDFVPRIPRWGVAGCEEIRDPSTAEVDSTCESASSARDDRTLRVGASHEPVCPGDRKPHSSKIGLSGAPARDDRILRASGEPSDGGFSE